MKSQFVFKKKAFVLIELVVVLGIIILLISAVFINYRSFKQRTELKNASQQLINTLQLAQSKATASEEASAYGLHLQTDQYVLFQGTAYQPGDPKNQVYQLPQGIEISSVSLKNSSADVVFQRITGQTENTGQVKLSLISQPDQNKTICLSDYLIQFCPKSQLEEPPEDQWIEKSRHVHFQMDWSIKNATWLKFYFPHVDQTEKIEMSKYFKKNKEKFDWKGEFEVNEQKQKYHVHTHQLTDLDTLLCIHRDGNNTEEVVISIIDGGIDKEIVHYFADGQGPVGPYGGRAEEQ